MFLFFDINDMITTTVEVNIGQKYFSRFLVYFGLSMIKRIVLSWD